MSSYSHVRQSASLYNIGPTKFWMAVDVETKYLLNSFPYVEEESRSSDVSMPTDIVMKFIIPFMIPLSKKGHNITSDNYFTSLDLCLQLEKQGCSLVGTI